MRRTKKTSSPAAVRRTGGLPRVPARRKSAPATLILTVGHSTRPISDFIELLQAHGVQRLIDIRTVPRSRHNPQFGAEKLRQSLQRAGIAYEHWPSLGGLRKPIAGSPNTGWRNLSFRGYADHMQTPEFKTAIDDLIRQARRERLVLMCAEAVPWRCHRSLIADALLVRKIGCEDIRSPTRLAPHRLTPFARVRGTNITYPPELAAVNREPKKVSVRTARRSRTASALPSASTYSSPACSMPEIED
jgi:hypothetical protein